MTDRMAPEVALEAAVSALERRHYRANPVGLPRPQSRGFSIRAAERNASRADARGPQRQAWAHARQRIRQFFLVVSMFCGNRVGRVQILAPSVPDGSRHRRLRMRRSVIHA